jgi:hypothetical protein
MTKSWWLMPIASVGDLAADRPAANVHSLFQQRISVAIANL